MTTPTSRPDATAQPPTRDHKTWPDVAHQIASYTGFCGTLIAAAYAWRIATGG